MNEGKKLHFSPLPKFHQEIVPCIHNLLTRYPASHSHFRRGIKQFGFMLVLGIKKGWNNFFSKNTIASLPVKIMLAGNRCCRC